MHVSSLLLTGASLFSSTTALSLPSISLPSLDLNLFKRSGSATTCPEIWTTISTELTASFLTAGQCTDLARGAIRFAFHDAGAFAQSLAFYAPAAGGADGSLLLAAGEIDRAENKGLGDYFYFIQDVWNRYKGRGVGAADLIQFAAAHAIVTCPGGPAVRTLVGRKDSSTPAPTGLLPPGGGPGSDHDSLFKLFQDKGFSAADLAALIGAHTASKAFAQSSIPVGTPQDSTPGVFDVKYYSETYNPPAGIARFPSDINLSNKSTTVGKEFSGFVDNQSKWTGAFADAMYRLSILGIPSSDVEAFVDCTGALPKGTSAKRNIRAMPINDRAR